MSRKDLDQLSESEKKTEALRKKLFYDAAAQVLPEAVRKPVKTTVSLAEHWIEDQQLHPEASALEHVVAIGAQTAAEMAVKAAVLKGAKAIHPEAVASAPGKLLIGDVAKPIADPLGKKVNEAVHQLFADARVANPTEEMRAQWQQSWEQRDCVERFQESIDAVDRIAQARKSVSEREAKSIKIQIHSKAAAQSVPGLSKPVHPLSISDGKNTIHTHDPLEYFIEHADTISDFTICVEDGVTCKDISLPQAVQQNILSFIKTHRNPSDWNCEGFAAAAHGLYEEGSRIDYHTSGRWDISFYLSEKKIAELKSGDFVGMMGGGGDGHAVIYLGEGFYLSKLGFKDGLVICRLEDMQKPYQRIMKFTPRFPLLSGFQESKAFRASTVYEKTIEQFVQSASKTDALRAAYTTTASAAKSAPEKKQFEQPAMSAYQAVRGVPSTQANGAQHQLLSSARSKNTASAAHFQRALDDSDRMAEMQSSMLHLTQMHLQLNVPVPSKKLIIHPSDTTAVACVKLDAYFDDVIRNYPESTKRLLRDMYYRDKNVSLVEQLVETGCRARAICKGNKFGVHFSVEIDKGMAISPIDVRMLKMHEIAVHVGQQHQRIEQVGMAKFFQAKDQFSKFTEQSVAIMEKIMIDSIPEGVILQSGSDLFVYLDNTNVGKKTTVDDYLHLAHRENCDKLTPFDHELFLQNKNVDAFLKKQAEVFFPGVPVNYISTAVYRKALEKMTQSFPKAESLHAAYAAASSTAVISHNASHQRSHSYEHHLAHLHSSVRNQTESQRQHFARMGMPEYTALSHDGGVGIRVYGTAVSDAQYAAKLNPAKRAVFEEWLRSRLPFATAEAAESSAKLVVVRRSNAQPTSQRSAYHLQRQFLDEVTVPVHSTVAQHAQAKIVSVALPSGTNVVTAHLNAQQVELQRSVREANKIMQERSQFHAATAAQFKVQRDREIISTSGEIFGIASKMCRYVGDNSDCAQFLSSTFSLFSGFCSFILSGSPLGLIMPFVSFFLNNRAAEAARRFAEMIEAASQSLSSVHQDVIDELHDFQILLQKEIRYTGALVAEILAEQNTCHRLNDAVFNELMILENTMGKHFENTNAYLHVLITRDLKTKCEHLQSYLNETNGVQPSIKQIRQDLHDLEFWIMSRLHHPMMNGASYLNATSQEATDILLSQAYPLITMPSFFASRVYLALGETISPAVLSLPPMSLYFSTIQLFCKTLEKHPEFLSQNKGGAVFAQILNTLTTYGELIAFIKANEMKIRQSQLSAQEKEIILKPLAQIAVYETAVDEMKKMILDYQKRLQFLTDPVQQLEALTRAFFYPHGDAPESQGAFWKNNFQAEQQAISCVIACSEFADLEQRRAFIKKCESRNLKAVTIIIEGQRFLQLQLDTSVVPSIMPAHSPAFFKHTHPALLTGATNTTQSNQLTLRH